MEWTNSLVKVPELNQPFGLEGRNSDRVLSCDKEGNIYFAVFIEDKKMGRYWATSGMSGHRRIDTTHWMKVPKAPERF